MSTDNKTAIKDVVLQKIHSKTQELYKTKTGEEDITDFALAAELWNEACKTIYEGFITEGLKSSAKDILKWVRVNPDQQIVESNSTFSIATRVT